MKTHFNNQGEEIEAPSPVAPAQSVHDFFAALAPEPAPVAGPLSDEHKKILSAPEGLDRRDFDYMIQSGQGMGSAFAACASGSPDLDAELNELCKVFGKQPVKEQVRVEKDQLDDGTWSISEYDANTGRLLRGYISEDGLPPAAMRS